MLGTGSTGIRRFFRVVTDWHRWLAMEGPRRQLGKAITGAGNLIFLGLALTGMEFVQFTPTALAYPKALEGTSTGGVLLGLPGTRLWNARNERFMERYDPARKEASTRAILSRAIQTEVVAILKD